MLHAKSTLRHNFDNNTIKRVFSSSHERGTKKKPGVPRRNPTSDLRIPRSILYHLTYFEYLIYFNVRPLEVPNQIENDFS